MALAADSGSLDILPPVLRNGLTAVVVLSSLSLLSSLLLFTHLTVKLIRYRIRRRTEAQARVQGNQDKAFRPESLDLELVLEQANFGPATRHERMRKPVATGEPKQLPPPNQFVVLFHSLLLADLHQAVAFFLNIVWVARDGITVGSPACWAQGLFISNGDLASSCFIVAIALHTYLSLVREYRLPQMALYAWITGTWIFVYGVGLFGVVLTENGRNAGGYFVRASAWCWINDEYEELRLLTHYLYIFLAIVSTSLLYSAIFFSLRARLASSQGAATPHDGQGRRPGLRHKASLLSVMSWSSSALPASSGRELAVGSQPRVNADHHPAFLVYPLIYVLCTMPLAVGRIAAMSGVHVPLEFFCAAGALIVSNGWLDVLLWGTTRHTVVFGRLEDADALGLDTFDFMRTPSDRRFGNFVWVQGASDMQGGHPDGPTRRSRPPWWIRAGEALGMGGTGVGNGSRSDPRGRWKDREAGVLAGRAPRGRTYRLDRTDRAGDRWAGSSNQSPVACMARTGGADMSMAIQMDRVVTVVEEDSSGRSSITRFNHAGGPGP